MWNDESAKDFKDSWQNAKDEDDDENDFVNEDEKLDFAWDKIALGESIIAPLHLCLSREKAVFANAYANGHQPQISFLCELDQTEIVRILRFFRIWLRHDGYRLQIGLWLFRFLALLDTLQPREVYYELLSSLSLLQQCLYANSSEGEFQEG